MDFRSASALLDIAGNEVRLRMMMLMRERELSVSEISDEVGLHQSPISQHLKRMRDAGVVSYKKKRTERIYYLTSGAAEKLLDLLIAEFPARKRPDTKDF